MSAVAIGPASGADPRAGAGARRRWRNRPAVRMQPPLTPMIDVTFQLLLFFLLTMQFRQPEGQIPANLPAGDAGKPAAAVLLDPIWIRLHPGDADGVEIEIDRYDLAIETWADLHNSLVGLREQLGSNEIPIVIKPYPGVSWEASLNAFNEALRAEFRNVAWARE